MLISREHPLAGQPAAELPQLNGMALLTRESDSHYYNEMKELYEKNGLDFNVAFMNTNETDIMLDMVKAGTGILLVTESVGKSYENEDTVSIPITPAQEILTFLAYPKRRRLTGAFLAFRNYVLEQYR